MNLNESQPEAEEMTTAEIQEASRSWLHGRGFGAPEIQAVLTVLKSYSTMAELALSGSTDLAQAGLDLDLLDLLRGIGAIENEEPGVLIDQEAASDAEPTEALIQRTRRMLKLAPYVGLVSAVRIEQLLDTNFMADDSEELNLYRSIRWTIIESLQSEIHAALVQEETARLGKAPSQKRVRELKKAAESTAEQRATALLAAKGILEPVS